jgi:hypothetical protein
MQIERIRAEHFLSLVGQKLSIQAGQHRLEVEVLSVARLPAHHLRPEAPFSLVLRAPGAPALHQSMVGLTHPTLGLLELFLVPTGPDAHGMRYEITFN